MTAHTCTVHDPSCFRCELSRDEVDDYPLICEGCGRHLPCRHCEEPT